MLPPEEGQGGELLLNRILGRTVCTSAAKVDALKKKMIRRYYLRPSYLWKRLRSAGSAWELGAQIREGLALLRRNV